MALFRLQTDRVTLSWSERGVSDAQAARQTPDLGDGPPGGVRLLAQRPGASVQIQIWPDRPGHPYLFEHTDYRVFAQSKTRAPVALRHRDPTLLREIDAEDQGRVLHGVVNYGAQIGQTRWELWHDGQLEVAFGLEVFPTKLSYREDYDAIMAEVQGLTTALGLEYMRATTQPGQAVQVRLPAQVEWLTMLRLSMEQLERAMAQIERAPLRALAPKAQLVRVERAAPGALGASQRAALERGRGQGGWTQAQPQALRERVWMSQAALSAELPEHRWVAQRLGQLRRRLLGAAQALEAQAPGERASARALGARQELLSLAQRVARWTQAEPWVSLADPGGATWPASASAAQTLAMWRTPGYAELARVIQALELGLEVGQGPLQVTVKDLSVLYEYWCFLTMLRLLLELTGASASLEDLFAWREHGLSVRLEAGARCVASLGPGRGELELVYGPTLSRFELHPQRPDLLLSVRRAGWPTLHLIMDAKYRLERGPQPGPPMDAINALHRYRDAIVQPLSQGPGLEHAVVQAVAIFPYREVEPGSYASHRLWGSLRTHGIGALPMLPGSLEYARRWLRGLLDGLGWGLATGALGHAGARAIAQAREQARQLVVVGPLRGLAAQEHLRWIEQERCYYMSATSQPRAMAAGHVAIYSPAALAPLGERRGGAITHLAQVLGVRVLARGQLQTPWASRTDAQALQIVYELGPLTPLERPIPNEADEAGPSQRFGQPRTTTRLALERAAHVRELALELEPERRLYDALCDALPAGQRPGLDALPATPSSDARGQGRARIHVGQRWARLSRSGQAIDGEDAIAAPEFTLSDGSTSTDPAPWLLQALAMPA